VRSRLVIRRAFPFHLLGPEQSVGSVKAASPFRAVQQAAWSGAGASPASPWHVPGDGAASGVPAAVSLPFSHVTYPQSGHWNNQLPALSACMGAGAPSLLGDVAVAGVGCLGGQGVSPWLLSLHLPFSLRGSRTRPRVSPCPSHAVLWSWVNDADRPPAAAVCVCPSCPPRHPRSSSPPRVRCSSPRRAR